MGLEVTAALTAGRALMTRLGLSSKSLSVAGQWLKSRGAAKFMAGEVAQQAAIEGGKSIVGKSRARKLLKRRGI